jgi:hypothetical protein
MAYESSAALERLDALIGRWKTEGSTIEAPESRGTESMPWIRTSACPAERCYSPVTASSTSTSAIADREEARRRGYTQWSAPADAIVSKTVSNRP